MTLYKAIQVLASYLKTPEVSSTEDLNQALSLAILTLKQTASLKHLLTAIWAFYISTKEEE